MSTTEIAKTLVSPAEKLIDAISGAIEKAYEPKHIRKMADAKAYELEKISNAIRNNSDVPIVYNSAEVSSDTSNYEEIAKRASSRLTYQEITKQQNIEAVADIAYQELEKVENVEDEPVSSDWMFRFFNLVENISNEDMQKIWGRILAGEIRFPNTFSYRTLEKLKNMTQNEAEIFQRIVPLAIDSGKGRFIFTSSEINEKYNIKFSDILTLEECGLITAHSLFLKISVTNTKKDAIRNLNIAGVIQGTKEESQELSLPVYIFTDSGSQLIDVVRLTVNNEYFIECLKFVQEKNKEFKITAHEITSIDNGMISYKIEDILSTVSLDK